MYTCVYGYVGVSNVTELSYSFSAYLKVPGIVSLRASVAQLPNSILIVCQGAIAPSSISTDISLQLLGVIKSLVIPSS